MPRGSLFPLLAIVGPCLAVVDHTCFEVSLAPGENKGEVFIVIPGSCLLECRTLCETYPECSSYKYDIERTGCELYRDQANATGRTTKTLPDQLTKVFVMFLKTHINRPYIFKHVIYTFVSYQIITWGRGS